MKLLSWVMPVVAAVLLLTGCGAVGVEEREEGITVFAAASLTEVMQELGPVFSRSHPGVEVAFNFAGTQQLRTQLAQGARADVFLAADEANMGMAVDAGLVETPVIIVRNRLVLIVPADNPAGIAGLVDLTRKHRLVMGVDDVPFGRYARRVLQKAESVFGPGFASGVLANVVSEELSVKQSLAKVTLGEADAGFCYLTDVTPAVAPRVRVIEIPEAFNVPAAYPAAVVREAPNPEAARAWLDFLTSPEAADVFRRYGFDPL